MAFRLPFLLSTNKFIRIPIENRKEFASSKIHSHVRRPTQSIACTKLSEKVIVRRSANYQPPIWDYDYVQSLRSLYKREVYTRRAKELKDDVRMMLVKVGDPLHQIELIDTLQRLGLTYLFNDEVKKILRSIYNDKYRYGDKWRKNDFYATALEFRLLRQYGYNVTADIFNSFKDTNGSFESSLCDDARGMLYLYEASQLLVEGEDILGHARCFATKHLEEYVTKNKDSTYLSVLVSHALEFPLHWRIIRSEARWFIDVYEKKDDMNPLLLELGKLDFNFVQATHQDDLRYSSKWWRNTGLGEKLPFARDRLMENFLWTVGIIFEPQFRYCRRSLTKVNALITTIDDVYDVYGTLDELELFTNAVERWDINEVEQLPDYMKICFFALFNSVNEMVFDVFNKEGVCIIAYLKKAWTDLCKSYLVEAKWYYSNHTPTLQEYLDNARISISGPVILLHAYFWTTNKITKEALQCLEENPNIVRWSSMILRLADDLGTSSDELKRGDVPKSIQCYMHETGASEEAARAHIRYLISETWKKMNEDCTANSPFTDVFKRTAMNLARMAQFMYQHGDGHATQGQVTKDRVLSLLIQPIPTHT